MTQELIFHKVVKNTWTSMEKHLLRKKKYCTRHRL